MSEAKKPDWGRLYNGVVPYVAVEGAAKAVEFYKRAFGAVQHGPATADDKGVIMNVEIEINGGMVMVMDHMEGMGMRRASERGHPIHMQLVVPDGRFWMDRAVAAGCTVVMPFDRQFWGDDYGSVTDPFGIDWAFNQPSAENMARAEAEG
jgi:PhnB protein